MEPPAWKFRYRVYKKQRAIQFKPFHDAQNHMSIIWTKGKELSKEQFDAIDAELRHYIQLHHNLLTFTILRACTNCTYGRFSDEFENLILSFRARYKGVFTGKDLTLDDPKHAKLHELVEWSTERPIIHHVHGQSDNADWEALFRGPDGACDISRDHLFGTQVVFEIEFT